MIFSFIHPRHPTGERLLLHFSLGNGDSLGKEGGFFDEIKRGFGYGPDNPNIERDELPGFLANKQGKEFMNAFRGNTEATIDDVKEFLIQRETSGQPLNDTETYIRDRLSLIANPDPSIRDEHRILAQKEVAEIIERMNAFNLAQEKLRAERGTFNKKEVLPLVTDKVIKTSKNAIDACVEGFQNANGTEKAMILAGLVTAVVMLRALMQSNSDNALGKFIKSGFMWTAGGLGTVVALEMLNKGVEKTRGRPLFYHDGDGWAPTFPALPESLGGMSQEEWEDKQRRDLFNRVHRELVGLDIDPAFIDSIGLGADQKKYVLGVSDVSDMDVPMFIGLYQKYRGSGMIPDNAYDHLGHEGDFLSSAERFFLFKDIGQTVGLVQENGTVDAAMFEELKEKDMADVMSDWRFTEAALKQKGANNGKKQ